MKKNETILSLLFTLLLSLGNFEANACTGFRLIANDGGVIYGRSMEWGAFDLKTRINIIPRGYVFKGLTPDGNTGKEYIVKYGVVGLDMPAIRDGYLSDGMNEKGLALGMFYHPEFTQYPEYKKSGSSNTISAQDVANYVLSQFATVEEVKEGLAKVVVVGVKEENLGIVPGLHWIVTDVVGSSIVIEYNNGELKLHDAPLGVITNAPNYDWHMTNLQNFVNLSGKAFPTKRLQEGVELRSTGAGSGLLGLPGDNTPPSRFIRAVTWTQTARPLENAEEGIYEAFRILDNFQLPLGPDAAEGSGHGSNNDLMRSSTIWTVAWDLKSRTLNYHTQHNRRVRQLSMGDIDFSQMRGEIAYIPLDEKKEQDILVITPNL